jgi:hypothetical protein
MLQTQVIRAAAGRRKSPNHRVAGARNRIGLSENARRPSPGAVERLIDLCPRRASVRRIGQNRCMIELTPRSD